MKKLTKFSSMLELIDTLKLLRKEHVVMPTELYPIEPVQVGKKIGIVSWHRNKLEYLPMFDEIESQFSSPCSCVCVRKGICWGVLDESLGMVLPIAYNYSEAKQVCYTINKMLNYIFQFDKTYVN